MISFISGIFFAAQRIYDGDLENARLELISGLLGDFPGLGWSLSAVIDVALLADDIKEAV